MKKIMFFLIALIIGAMSLNVSAQSAAGSSTQSVERVTPTTDRNPVVGEITLKNGQSYKVRKGQKGGYYVWRQKSRGAKQGEYYKYYPNKEERKSIRFYK